VRDHHQGLLSNVDITIMQQLEDVLDSLIHLIWESIEHVCQSDYDVGLHSKFNLTLHDFEKQIQVLSANRRSDTANL
jgi:hypothetical protein